MLSIFQKNTYLVDLIGGITDFHNHILPGIDDGANSPEESLDLIKKFKEFGIENFIATPHVMGDYYSNTPQTINRALKKVQSLDNSLKIKAAAEYMMDNHLIDIIEKNDILTVTTKNVLVEMSYIQPPINLPEILFKLQNHSFSPILAHPERYPYLYSKGLDKYHDLKSRGCSFQLNMLSLSRHYGSGIQKIAFQLLENDMIDYISSDVHRMDHLEKIEKIKIPKTYLKQIKHIIAESKNLF